MSQRWLSLLVTLNVRFEVTVFSVSLEQSTRCLPVPGNQGCFSGSFMMSGVIFSLKRLEWLIVSAGRRVCLCVRKVGVVECEKKGGRIRFELTKPFRA